jgi:hypothetical protein
LCGKKTIKKMKTMSKFIKTVWFVAFICILSQVSAQTLTEQINSKTYTLSQRGSMTAEHTRTRMSIELKPLDATGYSIKPGETIVVNVQAAPGVTNLPKIFFQSFENGGEWHGWMHERQLTTGDNTITYSTGSVTPTNRTVRGDAAIFFNNEFFRHQQGNQDVIVTIKSGGTRHPIYVHGETNPTAFKSEVDAHTGNNIAVAVSKNAVITTSNAGMKSGLDLTHGRGFSISNVMGAYEKYYWEFNTTLSGFDMDVPVGTGDSPAGGMIVATSVASLTSGAAAGGGVTGYNAGNTGVNPGGAGGLVNYPNAFQAYVISHEIGHQWEPRDLRVSNGKNTDGTTNWSASEVGNLVHQEYGQYIFGATTTSFDGLWVENFVGQGALMPNYHVNRPNPINANSRNEQNVMAIAIYQVLLAYDYAAFGRAAKHIRSNQSKYNILQNATNATQVAQRWENMVLSLSNAVGHDLTPHFAHYHIHVSEAAKQKAGVDQLPKDTRKTYYAAPSKNRQSESSAFKNTGVTASVSKSGNTVTCNVLGATANEILCYEVFRNGVLIQVAYPQNGETSVSFTDANSGEYTVIAYDRTFQPHTDYTPDVKIDITGTAVITVNSSHIYTGSSIEPTDVTVRLNSEELTAGTDFTITDYSNNTNAGTANIIIKGAGKYIGETSGNFTIEKASQDAPDAPTLASKTQSSVILTATQGYEYRINESNWQPGNRFDDLTANTTYTFYQRIAETNNYFASETSAGLDVKTDESTTNLAPRTSHPEPLRAWIQNNILHIEGLTIGQIYRIYTVSGTLVYQGIATENPMQTTLPHRGTYIIHSENKSIKIIW